MMRRYEPKPWDIRRCDMIHADEGEYVLYCDAQTEIERLRRMLDLRGTGPAERYWEGRWRDEAAEIERLRTIIDNLHAVEEKHRETANAEFHRANRLQVENERLREALKGMDLEAQRETVEAMLKPTLIHLVMKMSDDARATLAIMTGAAKGASDGGL